MTELEEEYSNAIAFKSNTQQFDQKLLSIVQNTSAIQSDDNLKAKELSFYELADLYCSNGKPEQVQKMISDNQKVLSSLPGAKSAKILKNLVDRVQKVPNTVDLQVSLCELVIDWCKKEERTHLRHKQSIKLSALLLITKKYKRAIDIIEELLVEVRKSDDKHLLVEAQLIESRVFFALENYSKAKASLTSARASANQVYCEPQLQADLDLQSGIIFAQDKDYKTSYSYYYESFEAYHQLKDDKAIKVLKYMILCKIMSRKYDDVAQLLGGKYGTVYQGIQLDAVSAVSKANQKQSLVQFQEVLKKFEQQLSNDTNIKIIIDTLYEQLLEENLFKIIEPYSKVQISHIAQKINLDAHFVQTKLSELILDKKIDGTLDQGNGCLILFDDIKCDSTYTNALELMKGMDSVVDKLFERSKQIKA